MNDYAKYQFILNLLLGLFNTAMLIGGLISMRKKAAKEAIETQKQRIDGLEKKLENVPATCCGHVDSIKRLDGHNDRLQQHKELLTAIEADLKHLPKNSDIGKLHEKINAVNEQLAGVKAELGKVSGALPGLTHVTEMMNDFLLHHGDKK